MRTYKKLLFFIVFIITNSVFAQNFERFSNKEGFNQNTISSIVQDRYGFLWFGTSNGLIKYDGYEFKTFTTQSNTNGTLVNNNITELVSDGQGILWVGTKRGLCVYVPWLEKFYTVPGSSKIEISHVAVSSSGDVWFSGGNQLYSCKLVNAETGEFKVSSNFLKSFSKNVIVNCFNFKGKTSLILGTSEGLKRLDLSIRSSSLFPVFKAVTHYEYFKNSKVTALLDVNNILWVGTLDGVFKVTIEGNRTHLISNEKQNDKSTILQANLIVNTIYKDHSGTVWIGTKDHGLYKYNNEEGTYTNYSYDPKNKSGLSSGYINVLFQDDYNVLWIGTAQGGINKLDFTQKQFINYTNNPYDSSSIGDNLVTAILEDSKGNLWVSCYNMPLFKSTEKVNKSTVKNLKFLNLSHRFPLAKLDVVRCIFEDSKGFIWFGTDRSIVVYSPSSDSFKKLNVNGDVGAEPLYRKIIQLDDQNILFAGNKIVIVENPWEQINSGTIKIKSTTKLDVERIHTVIYDNTKTLWFGTNNGVFKGNFKQGKLSIGTHLTQNKTNKIHLSSNTVFSLLKDDEGALWVGTFGSGLNKLTFNSKGVSSKIDYFRKNDLLPDDAIYGILQENNKNLWISTDMGLVRFNKEINKVDVFDVRDGLLQNNFRQGAYAKGNSGYFYFGGLNGLTVFNPDYITLNNSAPKIIITDLLINNKLVGIGEKLNNRVVLEKSISETEEITVSQNQQILAFNVAVEHTSSPTKNILAYKLEGFNDTWVERKNGKATITYTNLSAGTYVFKVKASNGDGVWSTTTKDLKITILPPWYQTWWSYIILILVVLAICVGIIIYFVKLEILKQRLKYEELDKERNETINKGKFRYFTNLSHEFRTPLTLISGPLERIIAQNKDEANTKYLTIIEKNTKRLLSLVDQLITFRQAENGIVKLNLSKVTLSEFIYPTTEAFEDFATEKNINFFYKMGSPNEEIIIDIEKVERIMFNLLSNSFKNTPERGSISIESNISFVDGQKMIHIDVVDTGKGIPEEDLENVFERFYQLGNKEGNISGGGIGLAFCKSLIDLLEGTISVKSEPGVETRFSISIPSKEASQYDASMLDASPKSFIKDFIPLPAVNLNNNEGTLSALNTKTQTILIVENEVDVQVFLSSFLSEKYNVIVANNGIEGLEVIKKKQPDLIISDIMMPEMDGFEFCEKIKTDPTVCQIPVLLLTALGNTEDLIKGLEFGADEYISKPFSIKHLELRVEKLITNSTKLKDYFAKNSKIPEVEAEIEISTRDKEFLENIIAVIEANISNSTFGVEELSSQVGLSSSQFYRKLKQLTGQIPNAYLRNYRLQRAAELLRCNEGYNVVEVMYQIGIESNSYFSTSFKKLHGVSPSEFIKNK